MKLARIALNGSPTVVVRGARDHVATVNRQSFADLPELLEAAEGDLRRIAAGESVSADETQLLSPLQRPHKIICIGLNYRLHAEESKQPLPPKPVLFPKWDNAIAGPFEPVPLPKASSKVDWEAELAFVFGKRCRNVAAADAASVVFGFTCANDVSMRDFQFHTSQWGAGKAWDKAAPLGPAVVTCDEVGGAAPDLAIRGLLNGKLMQDSRTGDFIFHVPALVEYLTTIMTMEPGDLVLTGTPAGVGQGRTPPQYLQDGDEYEVQIEKIGSIRNRFVAAH
ncbi:MAG TPA: fumarylacetoacetate hydrolase family protein [Dehalococcoidia bacterium]|nr:fumarylacetoacetate hydrolase family protein [Dehalococcoidia bacterium]